MNTTATHAQPRLAARPNGQRPLTAIPRGAQPQPGDVPPHDFLVLNQRPDLTPEYFTRLLRVDTTLTA